MGWELPSVLDVCWVGQLHRRCREQGFSLSVGLIRAVGFLQSLLPQLHGGPIDALYLALGVVARP